MKALERQRRAVMTGAKIITLVEKREALRATIVAARTQVEMRVSAVISIALGAAALRFLSWWAVGALVAYQVVTGVKAYRQWKEISKKAQPADVVPTANTGM
jgi:hypothetical protein